MAMIKFNNVTKIYHPDTIVLRDISFEVEKGEFVSIVGKSGSGKTTLTRLILGLEEPSEGEVFFEETNLNSISSSKIQDLRRKIGVIYQDYKLLPTKTVYENVSYIMAVEGKPDKEIAEFCDIWKVQLKRYVEYMIFVNNNRTWPFGKFKDKKS